MNFRAVEAEHDELNESFLRHQEALLALDLERAAHLLDLYEERLLGHMAFEEEHLLPVYAREGTAPGGPVEFFTGEHARMREWIGRIRQSLSELRRDDPELRRAVIRLFDSEAGYKGLAEHHHLREANIFFPQLERVAREEEKAELLAEYSKYRGGGDWSGGERSRGDQSEGDRNGGER